MRRVVSVILFVLGGWILMSEAMVAWMDMGVGVIDQAFGLGIFFAFSAPFLLLGTWVTPGNRLAELGLTMMISAAVGAFAALTTFLALNDPGVAKMLPPGQPLPDLTISPLLGAANLVLVAGAGYLLRRHGRASAARNKPALEKIFGD